MKLHRIRARAFGRFEDFDSGSTPLADLSVVVGPNESGKTTFFHLLHSIIFGLYPASKDQHPYTPWSGRDIDVEAEIQLDDGEEWTHPQETCRVAHSAADAKRRRRKPPQPDAGVRPPCNTRRLPPSLRLDAH